MGRTRPAGCRVRCEGMRVVVVEGNRPADGEGNGDSSQPRDRAQGWRGGPVAHGARGLVTVDIAGFSAVERTSPMHARLRQAMYAMLEFALLEASVDFESCYHEDRGDGAVIVIPAGVSMAPVADRFVRRLGTELRHHNNLANERGRMRLRVSMHVGEVHADGEGLIGRAVIDVFRLLDAPDFKKALADSEADLAVIVSDRLHQDVIQEGWDGIDPAEYWPVRVQIKEMDSQAWIRIPGASVPGAPRTPGSPGSQESHEAADTPPRSGPNGEPKAESRSRPHSAKRFSARISQPRSPMSIAFGADDTLAVAGKDGSVYRWSLTDGTALPGIEAAVTHNIGHQLAASTTGPVVAQGGPAELLLTTFGADGIEGTEEIPLESMEFLVPTSGRCVATYNGRRVVVRSFADLNDSWSCQCPSSLANVTVSQDGGVVAMASGRELTIARHDGTRLPVIPFNNMTMAGCSVVFSPDDRLLACASFAETIVVYAATGKLLFRRPLGWSEMFQSMGATRMRTQVTTDGDVLRLSRGRLWATRISTAELGFPLNDAKYDDVVLDPTGTRVATVDAAGMVRIWPLYAE